MDLVEHRELMVCAAAELEVDAVALDARAAGLEAQRLGKLVAVGSTIWTPGEAWLGRLRRWSCSARSGFSKVGRR
jgi:hypothetical protein